MTNRTTRWSLAAIGLLAAAGVPSAAGAGAIADFYKGKTMKMIISTGVGGGHDQTSRIIARHFGNHIPGNPHFVPQNMPGGGHLLASNFVYNVAPQDGTVVLSVIPSIVMHQLLGRKGVRFDAQKFHWLGSSSASNSTVFVWHTIGVKTIADAKKRSIIMGATGAASNTVRYPTVLNNVVGTKFNVIMGYRRTNDVDLAMQRGEVQGRGGATFNTLLAKSAEWIRDKKIILLVQIGPKKQKGFEDVPLLTELAHDKKSREVLQVFCNDIALGRPYLLGPGVPAARVAALRTAFEATMKDPAMLAEANKAKLDISPTSGAELQNLVSQMVKMNPDLLARVKAALDTSKSVTKRLKRKRRKKKKH